MSHVRSSTLIWSTGDRMKQNIKRHKNIKHNNWVAFPAREWVYSKLVYWALVTRLSPVITGHQRAAVLEDEVDDTYYIHTYRQTNKQTDTYIQTHRQTNRQTHTERQTDRHIDRKADKQT